MLTKNERTIRKMAAHWREAANRAEARARNAKDRANMRDFAHHSSEAKRLRTKSLSAEIGRVT